jgi:hypothetical protein
MFGGMNGSISGWKFTSICAYEDGAGSLGEVEVDVLEAGRVVWLEGKDQVVDRDGEVVASVIATHRRW